MTSKLSTRVRRLTAGAVATLALTGAGAVTATSSAQAAPCSITAQAPYKHVRITGQKMVYGHGVLTCGAGVYGATTHARLAKLINGTWYWYGVEVYGSSMTNGVEDVVANEFLCSNYGFGGSGSGTFKTYAWASYNDYGGSHSTGYYTSGTRYLSC